MADQPFLSKLFKSPITRVVLGVLLIVGAWRGIVTWQWMKEEQQRIEIRALNGVQVNYILTPEVVDELPNALQPGFEVTSRGSVLMQSGKELVELEGNADDLTVDKVTGDLPAPDNFALDQDDVLLTISGQYFGQFEDGKYTEAVPLPSRGMRLMSSANPRTVYMVGPDGETSRRLYVYYEDGALDIVAQVPDPITAVADNKSAIYFSTQREIFRATKSSLDLVIRVTESDGPIVALAASPDDKLLYFSNGKRVYAMKGLTAIALVSNAGGNIRLRNGTLHLWDPNRKLLVALSKLEDALPH